MASPPGDDSQQYNGTEEDVEVPEKETTTAASRYTPQYINDSGAPQTATELTAMSQGKLEYHRKKGGTWLDIFSFARWRTSNTRPQGAIQLAQSFGSPNQHGRPGPVIGIFVCKGPRNELQSLIVAAPMSLERFTFDGRLQQRVSPPQPLTCCRGGKIGGVGRVLLCGSQSGRVFILSAESFELLLELDTRAVPVNNPSVAPPSSRDIGDEVIKTDSEEKRGASCSSKEPPKRSLDSSICALTINATFAEFAHFVMAGDDKGKTYVWQVPSTRLLLVLNPPTREVSAQQQNAEGCCGCCIAAQRRYQASAEAPKQLSTAGQYSESGNSSFLTGIGEGINAVGTAAEVLNGDAASEGETADADGCCGDDQQLQTDSLVDETDIPPVFQNTQWLSAKLRRRTTQIAFQREHSQSSGDISQEDREAPGIPFSDVDHSEKDPEACHLLVSVDGSTDVIQPDEALPYIQHESKELLQQLRHASKTRVEQELEATGGDTNLPKYSAAGAQAETEEIALCSPLGSNGDPSNIEEPYTPLEMIPLSPDACNALGSSPSVDYPQTASDSSSSLDMQAASGSVPCGSSSCCISHHRFPCGQPVLRASSSPTGSSRYVGALLPLPALDQLWVGYGDGCLAVFELSSYKLLRQVLLDDPDVSKIEYAKYRDLIIVVSGNRWMTMWCPRTLQCIFEMDTSSITCASPLSFLYLLEAPEAWELRATIILAGCMDGSICVRRLERNLPDGGICCKLVRNYVREIEPQVPISSILVDSWLNAAFVGDASGVVFTLPYVFQLLEAPALTV